MPREEMSMGKLIFTKAGFEAEYPHWVELNSPHQPFPEDFKKAYRNVDFVRVHRDADSPSINVWMFASAYELALFKRWFKERERRRIVKEMYRGGAA